MTIIELMTALTSSASIADAAEQAANSGIAGAKDVYLAWGKSEGHVVKELEAAWKDVAPATRRGARGFTEQYYDWLAEGPRTEQEAVDYVMSNESQNVRNYLTHHLNIWALAETVRSGQKVLRTVSGSKETSAKSVPTAKKASAEKVDNWEYNTSEPYADARSARETLKRVTSSKRPSKAKLNPSKVAHLEDEELTKAYTEAFSIYGGEA